MTKVGDLKEFGEELVPIIKELIMLAEKDQDKSDTGPEVAIITKLQKLVKESNKTTEASFESRAVAIVANRRALTEILREAAKHQIKLSDTQVRTIEVQRTALRNAYGLLLERKAFDPIARLLSDNDIKRLKKRLDGARQEVRQRRKAKKLLDTIIQAGIIAGRIAVKLAAL